VPYVSIQYKLLDKKFVKKKPVGVNLENCSFFAANGLALADVPALAFRQLKFIDKVEYYSFVENLFVCRYIGKPMLAAGLFFKVFKYV
jgi:hypothetical protein